MYIVKDYFASSTKMALLQHQLRRNVLACLCATVVAMCGVAGDLALEPCLVLDKQNASNTARYNGTCMRHSDCTLKSWGSAAGYCRGANENIPDVQCCVNVTCSAPDGTYGTCKSTDATYSRQCEGGRFVNAPECPMNKERGDVGTFQCCIPTGDPCKQYTVVTGDTLGELAMKFQTTVEQIMQHNPIIKDADRIEVGWTLLICPGVQPGPGPTSSPHPTPSSPSQPTPPTPGKLSDSGDSNKIGQISVAATVTAAVIGSCATVAAALISAYKCSCRGCGFMTRRNSLRMQRVEQQDQDHTSWATPSLTYAEGEFNTSGVDTRSQCVTRPADGATFVKTSANNLAIIVVKPSTVGRDTSSSGGGGRPDKQSTRD